MYGTKYIRFDWAMKKILRQKANFKVLEGFLTVLLKEEIKIEEILESEANQEIYDDKFNRVDILAKNSGGELIIIEVQVNAEWDFFHRMLYGTSKLVTQYLKMGEPYSNLKKVYSVNILYFDLGQGEDYVYHGKTEFVGIHNQDILKLNERQKELFSLEAISEIYPEYYVLKVNKFNDIAKDSLDEWIYYLKNADVKSEHKAPGLDTIKEQLAIDEMTPEEQARYDRHLDTQRLAASDIFTAKDQGIVEGIEIGKAEGLKKGIMEGEKKKQLEMVKNMLSAGLDVEVISNISGLSKNEIESLR